jgi:hypothetical protein
MKTHTVVVPGQFHHAGLISPIYGSKDPRKCRFDGVDIDMRACEFVAPPAVAWCAIYSLLSIDCRKKTRLLVPENVGVCVYLKSTGLFTVLQSAGVDVDDRGIREQTDDQVVLAVSRFSTETDVTRLVEEATEVLAQSRFGTGGIVPVVGDVFAELGLNAVQHSTSPVGAVGLIQFRQTQKGRRFVCVVADGGIGIRASLEHNTTLRPLVPYDWTAIELALQERISGTTDPTRGIGLYSIAEEMQKAGRQMIIHSGTGMMSVSALNNQAQRTTLFPGTLVAVEIPA